MDDGVHFCLIEAADNLPLLAAAAKRHRAETQFGDEHAGIGQLSEFHRRDYIIPPSMAAYVAPRLVITDALGRRTIPIERPVTTFGRRSECDVRLTGADVSRQHAELLLQDGRILLRDCESKFGTYVNGERITERELKPGDTIGLGQTSDTSIMFVTGADQLSGEQLSLIH